MDDGRLGELQGIYAEIEEAFRTKDLDVVAKYIAPNWVGMMGDEPVDRVQLLRNVKGQFETLDDISWPRTIAVIRSDATRIKVKAEGVYRATQRESGEPFEIALTNEDTWILGPEGWRNFASKSLG